MRYTSFTFALALLPAILQVIVAFQMSARRLTKEFPIFFAYTVFHVVSITATLISAAGSQWTYFVVYWVFHLIDVFFSLAVVQELYRITFKPFASLRSLGDNLFQWASMVLCAVTVVAASGSTGVDSSRLMSTLLIFSRSTDFIVVGLLCLLYGLAGAFGIRWQRRVLAMSLGLAVIATIGSAATAIRSQLGEIAHPMYSLVQPLAYNLACAFWVCAVNAESVFEPLTVGRFRRLAEWSRTVQEIGNR